MLSQQSSNTTIDFVTGCNLQLISYNRQETSLTETVCRHQEQVHYSGVPVIDLLELQNLPHPPGISKLSENWDRFFSSICNIHEDRSFILKAFVSLFYNQVSLIFLLGIFLYE